MAVKLSIVFFWVVMSCSLVGGYLHLQDNPEDGGSTFLRNGGNHHTQACSNSELILIPGVIWHLVRNLRPRTALSAQCNTTHTNTNSRLDQVSNP
jgi:hypothetical protein